MLWECCGSAVEMLKCCGSVLGWKCCGSAVDHCCLEVLWSVLSWKCCRVARSGLAVE